MPNHARHDDIQKDQVRTELAGGADGVVSPILDAHFVIGALLHVELEEPCKSDFIINQKDSFLIHDNSCSAFKMMMARAPPRALELSFMTPPCISTICLLIGNPSPVPSPFGFVVKNGSKSRWAFSAGIPAPVSSTSTTIVRSPG